MAHAAPEMLTPDADGFGDLARRGRRDWWRYGLALTLLLGLWLGLVTLTLALLAAAGRDGVIRAAASPGDWSHLSLGDQLLTVAFLLGTIALILLPARIVLPWLHRRPWLSFWTARPRFDAARAALSGGVFLVAAGLLLGLQLWLAPPPGAPDIDWRAWLAFAALALLLVPLQVAAEELLFRGYLMQAVGGMTRRIWARLLIPALLFTLAHVANPEALHDPVWAVATYVLIALYLGLLALETNGLETAIGVHAANNAFIILVANSSVSAIPSPAFFVEDEPDFRMGFFAAALVYALHYAMLRLLEQHLAARRGR